MANNRWSVNVNISPELRKRFNKVPGHLQKVRKAAVEAAGDVFINNTKQMVQAEDHVDTALFINSIGKLSDYPAVYKTGRRGRAATASDVIYQLEETNSKTRLSVGSRVPYAGILEAKYNMFARSADQSMDGMVKAVDRVIKQASRGL
jgi:hypothetical protein